MPGADQSLTNGPPVELVRTVTRDGLRLDGALALPLSLRGEPSSLLPLPLGEGRGEGPASAVAAGPHPNPLPPGEGTLCLATAAILLHGVAGNFYTSSTFEAVVPTLCGLGMAVLSVNTRGHDSVFGASLGNVRRRFGAAYEIVDECRPDIAAWIDFLQSRGHERIVLVGHSLGAIKAVYSQAHEPRAEVAGVIAVSPPRLSYAAFMNSAESSLFFESMSTAERLAKEGRGEDLFTSKFPFPLLIAASAYIDKYGPAERYNLLNFAAELTCPALFVYGSKELTHGGIAFAGLPEILQSLPHADRRTVAVVAGADHFYTGVGHELAAAVGGWLAARSPSPNALT